MSSDSSDLGSSWEKQPMVRVKDAEVDDNTYKPRPVEQWCTCGHCVAWPNEYMNVCCKDHAIWKTKLSDEDIPCITDSKNIQDLMQPAPLRAMYKSFCCYHVPTHPDAETLQPSEHFTREDIETLKMKQRRLAAYRSLVFWTFENVRKHQRYPLPACIYAMIRAMYPPTLDDEEYADWEFTEFVYDDDD